jgi:hypothetical protein
MVKVSCLARPNAMMNAWWRTHASSNRLRAENLVSERTNMRRWEAKERNEDA